jgi:hypothetical protein
VSPPRGRSRSNSVSTPFRSHSSFHTNQPHSPLHQHQHHQHHQHPHLALHGGSSIGVGGGSGSYGPPLLTIREIFRAFTDATLEPVALRNVMEVVSHFDPHGVGFVPHYAFTAKHFLLRHFYKTVKNPTLSQRANWENILGKFEEVREETEAWVHLAQEQQKSQTGARGSAGVDMRSMPTYAWVLAALVGPRVMSLSSSSSAGGMINSSNNALAAANRSPIDILSHLFARHYDKLPPPVPIPLSDLRILMLSDDRLVTIFKNYTIPSVADATDFFANAESI